MLKIEVIDQISSRKTIAKLDFCFKKLMVFPVFETVKVHDWLHMYLNVSSFKVGFWSQFFSKKVVFYLKQKTH